MRFVPRRLLSHEVPAWVQSGSLYFLTINCQHRGSANLTSDSSVAENLLSAAAHYHQRERWFFRLFLVMPDHVHALVSFPAAESMREVVRDWKRYTARACNIEWQRDFFDHRLRSAESWEDKACYIRENPVRKGLVACAKDWPWVLET